MFNTQAGIWLEYASRDQLRATPRVPDKAHAISGEIDNFKDR